MHCWVINTRYLLIEGCFCYFHIIFSCINGFFLSMTGNWVFSVFFMKMIGFGPKYGCQGSNRIILDENMVNHNNISVSNLKMYHNNEYAVQFCIFFVFFLSVLLSFFIYDCKFLYKMINPCTKHCLLPCQCSNRLWKFVYTYTLWL